MNKFYSIDELKNIESNTSLIEFFNLPSKISKNKYEKHFKQKYDEYFIKDLSLQQMRRYYRDIVYRFYIDNIEEIKINNNLFLEYIESLHANVRKSITSITIKSTYPEVLDSFLNRLNRELNFDDNIEYYMAGIVKGSSYKNKDEITKKILEYLGDDAREDFKKDVKLSYIIRKYYFGEELYYYCTTCGNKIESNKENKECKTCYLKYKQERANSKRENNILNNLPEHINYINGDFNTNDFYNEEYTIFCKKCNKESNFVFKSKRRVLQCPKCDERHTITHRINEDFYNIFKLNDRKFITPLEIDMINYDIKLCIEYNGLMFHSYGSSPYNKFNNLDIDKYYHLRKTERVQEKGFKLLHIFENEWLNKNKREVWKSIINSNLGNNIFIDDYIIKESYDIKDFIDNNSLKHYTINDNDVSLCAYNYEELIGLMIFRKIESSYEIKICCSKNNTNIDFNKLLLFFESNYECDNIFYYLDRRYETCILKGFDFVQNTEPKKYYFNDDKLNLIETNEVNNILIDNNCRLIFDCGYTKYEKIIEKI